MKNNILILIFLLCFFSGYSQEKPKVVATASMIWDIAKNIGGDHFEIECIVPIGGDPHIYDPTPRDAKLVAAADLILKNGLTFEGWLDELIENSGTKAKSILVTNGVKAITSQTYQNATDPHAWMDVSFGIKYAENIKNAMSVLSPEHADAFETNFNNYRAKLEELDAYILEKINTIPKEKRILITSHDAFQYYGRRYGVQLEAILGVSTDADVQTSDIGRLNKVIRENGVPAVFIESTINPKLLQQLASDNDIVVGGQLFADSIGGEDSGAPTYIDMLRHNTDTIVKGLLLTKEEVSGLLEKETSSTNYWLYGLIAILFIGGFWVVVKKLDNN